MKKIISIGLLLVGLLNVANAGGPRVRGNGGQAYGCVTADTIIKLANNLNVPVSKLDTSDQVLNQNNDKVQVYYIVAGLEALPMFKIETESGKMIKATEGHPFYSLKGILAAKDFALNSDIMTIDGFEKITKITNFTYAGYVYNLAVANINDAFNTNLESEDPFLGLTSKEHTIILNGFVSGDVIMQRLIAK